MSPEKSFRFPGDLGCFSVNFVTVCSVMVQCEICRKKFEQRRHLRLHFARTHVEKSKWTSKCIECGKVYADDEILRRHMKNHVKRKTKVSCPVPDCGRVFLRKTFLEKHIAVIHPETLPPEEREINNNNLAPKKKYSCSESSCGASFEKHHLLTQHSYIHTNIAPFPCKQCDKRFLTLNHKNRHEKVHDGYPCQMCDKILNTWSALLTHKAREHKKEYKCDDCEKVFFTPSRLKLHSSTHAEVRQVFQCSNCDRNFTRKNALKKHVVVVHEGVKKHICQREGCQKKYAHRASLEKHIKKCHESCQIEAKKPRSDKKSTASRILGIDSKHIEAAFMEVVQC